MKYDAIHRMGGGDLKRAAEIEAAEIQRAEADRERTRKAEQWKMERLASIQTFNPPVHMQIYGQREPVFRGRSEFRAGKRFAAKRFIEFSLETLRHRITFGIMPRPGDECLTVQHVTELFKGNNGVAFSNGSKYLSPNYRIIHLNELTAMERLANRMELGDIPVSAAESKPSESAVKHALAMIRELDCNSRRTKGPKPSAVIAELVSDDGAGRTLGVIAARLRCTESLVKKRVRALKKKLGAKSLPGLRRLLVGFDETKPFTQPIPDSEAETEQYRRDNAETVDCPNCGEELTDEQERCPKCGKDVSFIR